MMRIAGRDQNGKARGIKTDEGGRITQNMGSKQILIQKSSALAGYINGINLRNGNIRLPQSPILTTFPTALTVEASFEYIRYGDIQTLLCAYDTANNRRGYKIDIYEDKIRFFASSDGVEFSRYDAEHSIETGVRYHVTVSWSIGELPILYLDGNPSTMELRHGPNVTSLHNSDTFLRIGAELDGSRNFKGVVESLSLWSIARTEVEINSSLETEFEGTEDGLVGLWKLDELEGEIAFDSTENGNHGNVVFGVWVKNKPLGSIKPQQEYLIYESQSPIIIDALTWSCNGAISKDAASLVVELSGEQLLILADGEFIPNTPTNIGKHRSPLWSIVGYDDTKKEFKFNLREVPMILPKGAAIKIKNLSTSEEITHWSVYVRGREI